MAKVVTHKDLKSYFGEKDHLEASKHRSFSSLIFEMLSEKEPSESELEIFELILNLSIDHGPDTPSAIKVIEAAKSGKTISEAVAAGVLEINDSHGGAIEPCMENFYGVKSQESRVKEMIEEYIERGDKIPGFGHRLYKDEDPRAQLILQGIRDKGEGESIVKIAQEIEQVLEEQTGEKLPLNIDGAIAVALCSLGWEPRLGKAVFIIARVPGLCAHFLNNSV